MAMEEEVLDSRGRNITLAVVGIVVLLIAGLVLNNYRIKAGWLAAMKGEDAAARGRAAQAMMARGDVAEQLQGEPASVRTAAARALGEVKTRQAAENLIPFLKDGDQPVRELAIQGLIGLGPAVSLTPVVEKAFADSDDNVKKGGISVCKAFGAVAIEPCARKLATDSRKPAAEALVEIKNQDGSLRPAIVRAAVPFLGDANPLDPTQANAEETLVQAIDVLDRAGDETGVPALIGRLADPRTRRPAVGALGRKEDPRATGPLIEWLPRDATVRDEIVVALGQIADPRAVQPLIAQGLASESNSVRGQAADALRKVGPPAVPALTAVVRSSSRFDPQQRAGAARALGGLRAADGQPVAAAVTAAVQALTDADPTVRASAAEALGTLGEQASPAVVKAVAARFTDRDPSGQVQAAAARALAAFREHALPTLMAAFTSRDSVEVYWAGQALPLLGPLALKPLVQVVLHADPESARRAARLLGDLGDPEATAALLRARKQRRNDPEFQFAATTALQRLGAGGAG
jgi:HEAT repeat protein